MSYSEFKSGKNVNNWNNNYVIDNMYGNTDNSNMYKAKMMEKRLANEREEHMRRMQMDNKRNSNGVDKSIFKKHLLIYSKYCKPSRKFLSILENFPSIKKDVNILCIDPVNGGRNRPDIFYRIQEMLNCKIDRVPTLILKEGEDSIFIGETCFKWLQYMAMPDEESIAGFNENEMAKISDDYIIFEDIENYGSTKLHDASVQSYAFLDDEDNTRIRTVKEEERDDDINERYEQRVRMDEDIESRNENRSGNIKFERRTNENNNDINMDFQKYKESYNKKNSENNREINFNNPNLGFAGEFNERNSGGGYNCRKKDFGLNNRFEELQKERESNVRAPKLKESDIDWTTGEIKR